MSGRWLAKVDMRLANGSALPLALIGTWVTNRIGFCTAAALATAEAVLRAIGAAACSAAPLAALANCPESSWVTCTPHAASQGDAARVRPIRNAFRWGEGNRLLIMSAGEQEGGQRPPEASARRQVSPAGRGRNSAAIAFVDPLTWILGFPSLTAS